ncbi:cyclic nucleotide-gated ion channel [Coralliovum pocilloporae]|uniref:cyclic nucleotide-gated ion channel n=1 Tax=Coralliovum pocilloporae TaxID=3066369 RepID=UPI003306D902
MSGDSIRRRVFDLLERNAADDQASLWLNRGLVILIVLNVLAIILETVPRFEARFQAWFFWFEVGSILIFTMEFLARFWVSDLHRHHRDRGPWRARLSYLLQPFAIIDLLAIAPFYISVLFPGLDLRVLRLFRLVRFLKLTRYSPGLQSIANAIRSERHALHACLIVMIGLVLTASTLIYLVEHKAQPEVFSSIPAAMWWALATLTTVGYGDIVPVTMAGKIVGGVVMIFGLAMFALPIGLVATAFAREIHRRDFVVTWTMVARVPLFGDLSASEISEIMQLLQARNVRSGDVIVKRGDPAHSMYFVAAGEVQIELANQTVALEEGAFFGEVAVLRRTARSATVRALRDSQLLVLDSEDLHHLMDEKKEVGQRIRSVAEHRQRVFKAIEDGDMTLDELMMADGKNKTAQ